MSLTTRRPRNYHRGWERALQTEREIFVAFDSVKQYAICLRHTCGAGSSAVSAKMSCESDGIFGIKGKRFLTVVKEVAGPSLFFAN